MTPEEFRDDVYRFTKDLAEKMGVPLDPEEVWADCQQRMTPPAENTP